MITKNVVSTELSQSDYEEIMKAIETIREKLPFLISMSDAEKLALPKMSDKTIAFVTKSLEYAKTNPQLIPAFVDIKEFEQDMILVAQLENITRSMNTLNGSIFDTRLLTGSEAYQAALMFYQSTKMAAKMNLPGAKEIYEDLSKRFQNKSKPTETE